MLIKEEVQHIASLARMQFSEEELEKLQKDFGAILDFVGKLNAVDTSGVTPTAQVTGLENEYRGDAVPEEDYEICNPETLFGQAPAREGEQIKVKAVFE